EEKNDFERADRIRAELDLILDELRRAVGLGGRSRTAANDAERARVAVRKAITTALDRLAEHDTAFAQHLRIHVRTGIYCRYETDPANPIQWNVSASGSGGPRAQGGGQARLAERVMSSRKLSAAAAVARRQASRVASNPLCWERSALMAEAIAWRMAFCRRSRPVGSVPARSRSASLISSCERTSRTCCTGVSSQSIAAFRPGGVAE